MSAMRRCAALTATVTIVALVVGLSGAGAASGAGLAGRTAQTRANPAVEEQLLAMVNRDRAAAGAPAVVRDGHLDGYARSHVAAVAQAGTVFHSDIVSLLGIYTAVAENVAYAADAGSVHAQFMGSGPHYQNLSYAGYVRVGIGAYETPGRIYAVYVFAD